MSAETTTAVRVIGPCRVASCHRPATSHLLLVVGSHTVAGSVCDHCLRASQLAAFLLELEAG